ncbi:MAG: methyltransferase domain-containing protein [Oligoflexales bacterium]
MMQFDLIKEYYGKVLETKTDLKTTACCTDDAIPSHIKPILAKVPDEVKAKFYGCGVPIPDCLEGATVLDLGSGTGRDCFVLSSLVGEEGRVIGIDMTDEQLSVARKYQDQHRLALGYAKSNIDFRKGYIENLGAADIADNSVDLVVSNCVINLSPDKEKVFSEIFRVLKPGGELYFSDVYCDRRLPKAFQQDSVLLGECLGGALYFEDFRRILAKQNCLDFRVISRSSIGIGNEDIAQKVGDARFASITVRAFKLPLEDKCEDYGQVLRYKGTIKNHPNGFTLDDHHYFPTQKLLPVCANTAQMVSDTRYSKHFEVIGNAEKHFGLFDCGPDAAPTSGSGTAGACC